MSEKDSLSDVSTSAPSSSASASPPASPPAAPLSSSSGEPAAPSPSATDSPSPSSSEKNTFKSDREGLLSAVKSVVKTVPEKPIEQSDEFGLEPAPTQTEEGVAREPVAPPADGQSPPPTAQTQQPVDDLNAPDPTEGELSKLRPETRKRFERLLAQRNQARRELEALQPELTQHRQLQGYLQQNQLAPDDVNMLLGVGASLRRGDFQGFLNGVTPYVMVAQEALGLRFPKDIQEQVDQGTISTEAAADMTRTRHRAGQAEHRLQQQTAQYTQQQQQTAMAQVKTAVDGWEQNIRTRDPDYPQKAVAVRRFAQALLQERGTPRNVQDALTLIQNAYDEATNELARIRPAPKATRAVPASSQGSTVTSSREPTTMKEAALRALNGARKAV